MKLAVLFLFSSFLFLPLSWSQKLTANDLKGTWRLEYTVSNSPEITEEVPPIDADGKQIPRRYYKTSEYWVFQDKKVSVVDYPCCWLNSGKFSTTDSSAVVFLNGSEYNDLFLSLELKNDTLTASNPMCSYYFVRDTLSSDTLNPLIHRRINPGCLFGTWEIPVGEVAVEYDAIMVWYPWKMVDTFTVNNRNINWYWSKNRFYLDVDGVKRPFKVKTVSNSNGNLTLRPERWVRFYIKRDNLDAYMVESVWLRKVEEEE